MSSTLRAGRARLSSKPGDKFLWQVDAPSHAASLMVGVVQSCRVTELSGDGNGRVGLCAEPQMLGPDREFEQSGGSLRVFAIEIYDTMTAVRWRVAPEPDISTMFAAEWDALQQDVDGLDDWAAEHLRQKAEQELRMMRAYQFDLADDLETAYCFSGGGHGGGNGEMTGRATFEPAPPPSATRLVLGWHNVTAEIPIV